MKNQIKNLFINKYAINIKKIYYKKNKKQKNNMIINKINMKITNL